MARKPDTVGFLYGVVPLKEYKSQVKASKKSASDRRQAAADNSPLVGQEFETIDAFSGKKSSAQIVKVNKSGLIDVRKSDGKIYSYSGNEIPSSVYDKAYKQSPNGQVPAIAASIKDARTPGPRKPVTEADIKGWRDRMDAGAGERESVRKAMQAASVTGASASQRASHAAARQARMSGGGGHHSNEQPRDDKGMWT